MFWPISITGPRPYGDSNEWLREYYKKLRRDFFNLLFFVCYSIFGFPGITRIIPVLKINCRQYSDSKVLRIVGNKYINFDLEHPGMGKIIDSPEFRERKFVFSDRQDAGKKLGGFIRMHLKYHDPIVIAIPAGGIPVGKEVARELGAPFELAIVRKIQIPGNTEAGFGAVTWDDMILINEPLRSSLGLSQDEVDTAVAKTRINVHDRIARFTGKRAFPDLAGKTTFLVDDGLASGYTMLAAIKSIHTYHPSSIVIAVPTASASSAQRVAREVDQLVCLNIRSSSRFAVADAYNNWYDLDDREVMKELGSIYR
jgi:putative phosphoribosyl transferase